MKFLSKVFGDPNQRVVNKLQPLVDQINAKEKETEKLSDADLAKKTIELKEQLRKGKKLDDILVPVFAVVREAAKRNLKQRHFDVQLIGGIVLHQGKIAEMKTGEGKTLVATLPICLNALVEKGTHVITVNDYLAKRDAGWMGCIYHALGLSVGVIVHDRAFLYDPNYTDENAKDPRTENLRPVSRKEAYLADVTYGTNNEFGFDYLRDNMIQDLSQCVQRELHYAIVDEVDSILVDEARTPLIISAPAEESTEKYYQFARMVPTLKEDEDYQVDEKMRAVTLTDEGIARLEKMLGVDNIYEDGRVGIETVHHIEEALKAHALFKKDKDYVVKDGEVIIVDEFTGRLMFGRRYSEGLHQAIEAKENVEIKKESLTLATISFQNYFRMYEKLAGMTGTAETEAEEFAKIYELDVVVIPTNKPLVRKEFSDVIYKTQEAKFRAVVEDIKERHKKGQPMLVGTVSIEKNELLSELLAREGIPHEVLNAKNHEKEALIISKAGEKGAVTVATNMAGRGTDIVLGKGVVECGGLHVLGTERHESRRIDNQLRGRSGRQGDPGSSQFFVSLEDDLMRIFASERIAKVMNTLKFPEDQPIESSMVTRALEGAQKKVEQHNFDIRKHLVEYDDVMNKHREHIYKKRREILEHKNLKEEVLELLEDEVKRIVDVHSSAENKAEEMFKAVNAILPLDNKIKKEIGQKSTEQVKKYLSDIAKKTYEEKERETSSDLMRVLERMIYLRSVDTLWIEHLDAMDHLREGIGLRGYAQRDPLVEYKNEAYNMFQKLLGTIEQEIIYNIFKIGIARETAPAKVETPISKERERAVATSDGTKVSNQRAKTARSSKKVGRNEPCPCGAMDSKTGKPIKYKKCCGK